MKTFLTPTSTKRIAFFLLFDFVLSVVSLYGAYALRFNFVVPEDFLENFGFVFFTLFALKLVSMIYYNIYFTIWRFFGLSEAKNLFKAHLVAYVAFTLIYFLFDTLYTPFPRSVIVIDFVLSLLLLGVLRISKRMLIEQNANPHKPTLIIGVNSKTAAIIKSAMEQEIDYYPVAILSSEDEREQARNAYISNLKVYDPSQLSYLVETHTIEAVILTASLAQEQLQQLYQKLSDLGVNEIKNVKLLGGRYERLEDLSIEELLARRPKDLDSQAVRDFIKNKTVLITGAGGSIGSEIAKQCHDFGAKNLILVDNSEYNLYSIGEALPYSELKLLSVTDADALEALFQKYRVDIVIHAAAYKHVPICEANICSAVTNNVLGTKNVIDLSIAHDVAKVVIISTDKAVRPTNVMGATKRVGELYAQNVDSKTTEIVSVRFGNVLGSSGSVIPKFKSQIEQGGPLTVTHPEMTRYFMMIPEACQLVLQASAIANGGELFILDMGKPVKIVDLAREMIRLYGKEEEISIEFSGLRPGEKLYEELLIYDSEKKTQYASILIAQSTPYAIDTLQNDIAALLTCSDTIKVLQRIVPEFTHEP